MSEPLLTGRRNGILQIPARVTPGATSVRVRLNGWRGVNTGKDVWIGCDAIILPDVTIGRGAIVTAGSITKSVPPRTRVQGNPARPIATVEVPLGLNVSVKEFAKGLGLVARASPNKRPQENGT